MVPNLLFQPVNTGLKVLFASKSYLAIIFTLNNMLQYIYR
ncbi:hypothetical protein SAMN05216175_101103 [Neptunomonas qingdaonensis]|uniref:Uncharacterized protein n=1 Tax=Neptunomonas qingdaonensis TaxID=1045558 RepID=A0A1I2LNF3_9GAMM|nr:hypothetical protein SAMN05216175_101103 [Neptunomonas qingdaonensis]